MAQAVNCHPLIEGSRIKFYFSPCEMCGGQIDSSLCKYSTSVFCVIIILQRVPCLHIDPSPALFNLSKCLHP